MTTRGLNNGGKSKRGAVAPKPLVAPEAMRPREDGSAWRVRKGRGSVNLIDGVMEVPMEDTPEARHVRIHELLHARVTPEDLVAQGMDRGASWTAIQGCEDGRLGATAERAGLVAYTTTSSLPAKEAEALMTRLLGGDKPDYHTAASLAVASYGTSIHGIARAAINEIPDRVIKYTVDGLVAEAIALLNPADPASTIAAALVLDQLLEPEDEEGDEPARAIDTAMSGDPDRAKGDPQPSGCEANPASVVVRRLPLPLRGSPTRARGVKRSADAGRLTHARDAIDPLGSGRPFTRRQKVAGGIVVIDTSGSMNPDHEQIRQLVAAAPGAMIVNYSSRSEDGKVIAFVVGSGGMICTPEALVSTIGGGNQNDASVLAWAAKNGPKGPRVWVSDGASGNAQGSIGPGSIAFTRGVARRLGYLQVPTVLGALGGEA